MAFIAERRSASTAARYCGAIVQTCERLALFPLRGTPRDDIRQGLRLTHHKGRTAIAYQVLEPDKQVVIVGVFYGGQNHQRLLAKAPTG